MSELDDLENRFASLENACHALSTNVMALTDTLVIVADLQREQREQTLRQEKTDREIAAAKKMAAARYARTRTVTRWIALGMSVLIPVVSVIVYASLLVYVNELLRSQNKDRFANCTTRNLATAESIRREELLGKLDDNPAVRQVHLSSAIELKKSQLDCSQYLEDVK
jgi:hypothetical protein